MRNNRLFPALGLIFIALVILGFIVGGEPPDPTEEPVAEIVDFYQDNETEQWIGIGIVALGLLCFLTFTSYVRSIFRRAEGEGGIFSPLLFVGAAIFAAGVGVDMTITVALTESVDDLQPDAIQALAGLWHNDFVPIALGILVWLLSLALSILSTGALPKWLGWLALLLVVISFTPIGFISFPGAGILVIILSIVLMMRVGKGDTAATPPPPPPAPAA
jgi:hypothetical protein